MVSWVSSVSAALVLATAGVSFYLPLLAAQLYSMYYLRVNMYSIRINNGLTAIVHTSY